MSQTERLRQSSKQEDFGTKSLNSDGHLITEDSVLPTTAPGGAPERNRCYQTPATLSILPLAPAAFARSARLALLTSLRPRWGLAHLYCAGVANPNLLVFPLTRASTSLYRRNEIASETAGYIAFAAAAVTGLRCAR
jgi:hypothetical protein